MSGKSSHNLVVRPITLKEANDYIGKNHRHHGATVGCKFAVGLHRKDDGSLVGVATCGRPVARGFCGKNVLEVTRLSTDGTRNACSMLYGACCRVAKAMGYDSVVTYTLEMEDGSSLKAAGFVLDGMTKGGEWNTPARARTSKAPTCRKKRWFKNLN